MHAISATNLQAQEAAEETVVGVVVTAAWELYKFYSNVKTIVDDVAHQHEMIDLLADQSEVAVNGVTFVYQHCNGFQPSQITSETCRKAYNVNIPIEAAGMDTELPRSVCKSALKKEKCTCKKILQKWDKKIAKIQSKIDNIRDKKGFWQNIEKAFKAKENKKSLQKQQSRLSTFIERVERTRSALLESNLGNVQTRQDAVYCEMKQEFKKMHKKQSKRYKKLYKKFKKWNKKLKSETKSREEAISKLNEDIEDLKNRVDEVEADVAKNKKGLLQNEENDQIQLNTKKFWKNVEEKFCDPSREVSNEYVNRWPITKKVPVRYAKLKDQEKVLTTAEAGSSGRFALVKFTSETRKDQQMGKKLLVVTNSLGKEILSISNTDVDYIKMYAPDGEDDKLAHQEIKTPTGKRTEVAFNEDSLEDSDDDTLAVDAVRNFAGLDQSIDDNAFFGSKSDFRYRRGKCVKDENGECHKDYSCASIKLNSGQRHLVCVLSTDSARLEFLMLSFANTKTFRQYCDKCVDQHDYDRCDTFQCSSRVYKFAPGNNNLDNDCKPAAPLTDRENPLKPKAQIKSHHRLRQNLRDDLKMTPW